MGTLPGVAGEAKEASAPHQPPSPLTVLSSYWASYMGLQYLEVLFGCRLVELAEVEFAWV